MREAYRAFAEDVHAGEAIPPAAEWLLDNFHLVEAEVVNVHRDLPAGFHRHSSRTPAAGHRCGAVAR